MAQLYKQEFKAQEKAKEEHIKQAKEKAIEVERVEQQKREKAAKEQEALEASERERQEQLRRDSDRRDDKTVETGNNVGAQTKQDSSSVIASDWSQVSPEIAANYMASKTGVSASKWLDVIYKESSGNPYIENSLSCWGLLQIMQSVHGQVSDLSPQAYLDKAVSIYQGSGGTAWETW